MLSELGFTSPSKFQLLRAKVGIVENRRFSLKWDLSEGAFWRFGVFLRFLKNFSCGVC